MRGQFVHVPDGRPSAAIERLARWWSSASQGERFETLKAAIKGDAQAPSLAALQTAIYLAEVEAGEIAQG